MASGLKDRPNWEAYGVVTLTNVTATPQTFKVDCSGADTLVLDIAFTRVAGTQLNFSFSRAGVNDSGNQYIYPTVTYGSNTIANTPFTFPLAASGFYTIPFNISSIPIGSAGPITVSVSVTAGTTDALVITPIVGVLS